jgi:hypothetical protein
MAVFRVRKPVPLAILSPAWVGIKQKSPPFQVGLTLTPPWRGEFDGRIIFNGFATAKNLVIGY